MRQLWTIAIASALTAGFLAPAGSAEILKAVAANLPPYLIENSPQEPGFGYELGAEMAKRAGYQLDIEFMPFARAQLVARETPGKLIFLVRSPDREAHYSWLVHLYAPKIVFATTKAPIDSIEQAKSVPRVTVVPVSPQEKDLREAGITNLELIENPQLSAKMLESGRVDAWLTHDLRAVYVWNKLGFAPRSLVLGKPMRAEHAYLAAHKDISPLLKDKLGAAMGTMKQDGSYRRLSQKYFGEATYIE